jgi:nucleoid-associated protein YgaU
MTSDAKIGLLLGLVFIFIIAFLINGLPSFRNNNELTTNGVGLQNNPPGLAARERKVQEIFNRKEVVEKQDFDEAWSPPVRKQDIRSITKFPKNTSIVKPTDETKPSKPALPKTYVVVEGDNLAVIAKKFYGDEEGNKRINVTRIFQANRKLLGSPDEVYVGQTLIIPPLTTSASDENKAEKGLSAKIFEKVKSIGKRHLTSDGRKAKQVKGHTVKEGDSLWKIAVEQLGDGSRYTEIAKLNADILDDEDTLFVGIRLKLPAR